MDINLINIDLITMQGISKKMRMSIRITIGAECERNTATKDEFLVAMRHDLMPAKIPLHNLQGVTYYRQRITATPERVHECVLMCALVYVVHVCLCPWTCLLVQRGGGERDGIYISSWSKGGEMHV